MSDDELEEPAKRIMKRWQLAVVLLIFYVASIGPVGGGLSRAVDSGRMSKSAIEFFVPIYETVYKPLIWISTKSPFVRKRFLWYCLHFR